jgi:hypothetical protein
MGLMENVTVDWDTGGKRVKGYANAAIKGGNWDEAWFDAPMVSHIIDNLYVGGCSNGLDLPHEFVKVVSLYRWEKYKLGPDTEYVEVEMYDSHDGASMIDVRVMAEHALQSLDKGPVLIHCQAGLNRSNLVATVVLREKYGMTSKEAIALLREKRSPLVLCNETFEKQLLALDGE